jgi:hypothetical protein
MRLVAFTRKHVGWTWSLLAHTGLLISALIFFSSPELYSAHDGAIAVDIITEMPASSHQKISSTLQGQSHTLQSLVESTPPRLPESLPFPVTKPEPAPLKPEPIVESKPHPTPSKTQPIAEPKANSAPKPDPIADPKPDPLPLKPAEKPRPLERKTITDVLNEVKPTETLPQKKPESRPNPQVQKEPAKKEEKKDLSFDKKAIAQLSAQEKDKDSTPLKSLNSSEHSIQRQGVPGGSSPRLSLAQRDTLGSLLKEQLAQCWSIPLGVNAGDYKPEITLSLDQSGALIGEPQIDNPSPDPALRALADSAIRAVRRCAPFRIPSSFQSFYSEWRQWHITFDPKDFID